MGQILHGSATTTHAVRAAIQRSKAPLKELAAQHGLNQKTVAKWRKRTFVHDARMGPKMARSTVLTAEEEAMVVAFRQHTLLPLDDCLYALQATIPQLTRSSLHAARPPAMLFTASHGMAVPSGRPNQIANQGALLCQDWAGFGSVRAEHFLAASDVADDANVNGLVALLFACFGNGTPDADQFPMDLSQAGKTLPLAPNHSLLRCRDGCSRIQMEARWLSLAISIVRGASRSRRPRRRRLKSARSATASDSF
jgi:transposase-like protein